MATYTSLTDAATVDLPNINTPLSSALATKTGGFSVAGSPIGSALTVDFPIGLTVASNVAKWDGRATRLHNRFDLAVKQSAGGTGAMQAQTPLPIAASNTDYSTAATAKAKFQTILDAQNSFGVLMLPSTGQLRLVGSLVSKNDQEIAGEVGISFGGSIITPIPPDGTNPASPAFYLDGTGAPIRSSFRDFAVDAQFLAANAQGQANVGKWAFDQTTTGQFYYDRVRVTSTDGTKQSFNGFKFNRADAGYYGHLTCMECTGYGLLAGWNSRGNLFNWLNLESPSSMLGNFISGYLTDVGVDARDTATAGGVAIHRGNLFNMIKIERGGVFAIDSKADTINTLVIGSNGSTQLQRSSGNTLLSNTFATAVTNVGSDNAVRAARNVRNWNTGGYITLGRDGFSRPLPKHPNDGTGSWHTQGSGVAGLNYVVWMRVYASTTTSNLPVKKAIAAIEFVDVQTGTESITRASQSADIVGNMLQGAAVDASSFRGQDDFTFVDCVPVPLVGRLRFRALINTGGQGTVKCDVMIAPNLFSNGTFGGLPNTTRTTTGASGVNATIAAVENGATGWFGQSSPGGDGTFTDVIRGGLRIVGNNTTNGQSAQWFLNARPGMRVLLQALVKINDGDAASVNPNPTTNTNSPLVLAAGRAGSGTPGQQWASCTFAESPDAGRGDGSRIMQCVYEVPSDYNVAVSEITIGTIAKIGAVYVGWINAVDLDGDPRTRVNGPPSAGLWTEGKEVIDIAPTTNGYSRWKCVVPGDASTAVAKFRGYDPMLPYGSATFTPGTIANGSSVSTTLPPVPMTAGCLNTDRFLPTFSKPLLGVALSAAYSSPTASIVTFTNNTGASVTLPAGIVSVQADR